jgi:hypothetical protein
VEKPAARTNVTVTTTAVVQLQFVEQLFVGLDRRDFHKGLAAAATDTERFRRRAA